MSARSLFTIGMIGIGLAMTAGPSLAEPTLRQDPPPLAGWGQPGSLTPPSMENRYAREGRYRSRFGGASLNPVFNDKNVALVGWGQPGSAPPPESPLLGRNQNLALRGD
jgi:hypothetical protein